MLKNIFVFLLLPLFASCADVIHVREKVTDPKTKKASYNDIGGVPFYVKTEKFTHKTVYTKTWLLATLSVKKTLADKTTGNNTPANGKEPGTIQKQLLKTNKSKLDDIKAAIIDADNRSGSDAKQIIDDFRAIETLADDTTVPLVTIKNTVESEWVVDKSQQYYLNGPLPWFGTGNLSQDINPDGTLAKASSAPDTKLAEGISSLIPLKEFLTGKFVKSGTAAAADTDTQADTKKSLFALRKGRPAVQLNETEFIYEISLSIEEVGREYTYTKKPDDNWPADTNPISTADAAALFSVRDIGPEKEEKKKEDDGKKIGISGNIEFPKDWGAGTEPKK